MGTFINRSPWEPGTNTTMDAGAVVRTGHQKEGLLAHGYRRPQTWSCTGRSLEVSYNKGATFHNSFGIIQQARIPTAVMGRVESQGQGKNRQICWTQGEGKRKGSWNHTRGRQDLLSLQSGQVQLSEVQVFSCVQSLFQERTQCAELQRGQTSPGHYRGTLTL